MAISRDTSRQYDPAIEPAFADLPVKASTTVLEGAAVTDDGGNGVIDGALATNEGFVGFLERGATGTATAGEVKVKVRQKGIIKNLAVTGVADAGDLGVAVYATDNGTFTLTSSGGLQIGKVVQVVKAGYADVYFEGGAIRSV